MIAFLVHNLAAAPRAGGAAKRMPTWFAEKPAPMTEQHRYFFASGSPVTLLS